MAVDLYPIVSTGEVSFDEFLLDYDGIPAEWVRGKVIAMSPVNRRHQELTLWLASLLKLVLEEDDSGVVFTDVFPMRLEESRTGRCPDVLVVLTEHLDRVKRTNVSGPADFVIEVVSPDSFERDREAKFLEYETAGVREYWIVDPDREVIEQFHLAQGNYLPVFRSNRVTSVALPKFWIEEAWLWQDPLPKLKSVMKAWG